MYKVFSVSNILILSNLLFIFFDRYEKSALIYADTHSSFEEISLKFLQEWQIDALKTFLRKVINKYKNYLAVKLITICMN